MKIDGACHCGHIRYEVEVDPAKVVICHCTDCQTLSGSAFRTVVPTEENSFRLLSGTPKVIFSGPVGASAAVVSLRVGTIRQRDQLVPGDQYWFRSSQAWLAGLHATKTREKQPVFDAKGSFGNE